MPYRMTVAAVSSMLVVAIATLPTNRAEAAGPKMVVTASSVHPGNYPAKYAFDGNARTRWASRTPIGRNGEWLQIDLGKSFPINDISIRWETAHATQYKILVSDDGKTFKVVHTQTAGKGGTEKISGLNGKGRFVRLLATKASSHNLASIWEFSIGGIKIAKTTTAPPPEPKPIDASALTKLGVKEIVFAARECGADGHWYANFGYYSYDSKRKLFRKEGRLCKLDLATGKITLLVDDPEGSVRDPAVHYDGKTIVFSWRKSGTDPFNLYQINSDGTGLKRITKTQYDDIEPTFLPDGKIMFVSSRVKRWVQCWLTPVAVLHYCDADGKNIRQISANVEQDNTPWPLPDGRILYMRWEYVDRSQVDYHHLWTTNPDGTGQMVYFGNMHAGSVFIDAKPIPGTSDVLLINSPGHGGNEHTGAVAIVSDKNGPDDRGSMRNITRNGYRDPYAISADTFIAARRRDLVMLNPRGQTTTIYTLDKRFGGGCQLHEPRPLIPRKRERLRPPRVNPSMATGQLMLMDVYNGRNMKGVKKGDIKKLLIVESLPKPVNFTGGMDPMSYGGTFTLERVLGTVPVEEDGSANFLLPAKRAFFFVALDANNNSVKRMHSFVSVMPGEMTSCVGCHEERKKIVSNRPTGGRPQAMKRTPSTITPNKGVPDIFDFPRDIQPILDKHCIKCHNSKKQNGSAILTGGRGPIFSTSYFTLTWRKQFTDGRNIAVGNRAPRTVGSGSSPIMKKITEGHNKVKLSQQEQDTIRYWIEAGAPYPGTYAALGCGSIAGYQQNRQVNTDRGWPELKPYQAAIKKRCGSCHKSRTKLPSSIADELGMSFWRFNNSDPRLKYSRHRLFDFTNPAQSLLLTAPLAEKAGGLEPPKKTKDGKDIPRCEKVFKDTNDPDYKALLGLIAAGKKNLNTIKRFDMPGFKPRPGYIREMKRYGALPNSYDREKDSIDTYAVDKKYFESLWYYPPGTKAPKMFNNVKGGSD
ncbi:MAG: discoidin domain-containing protein [Phycisphaerae bacterium]|nr:discoidin domain-containing protein [Phycisphaerae bacterium]